MWLTFSGNGLKFWAQQGLTPQSFHVLSNDPIANGPKLISSRKHMCRKSFGAAAPQKQLHWLRAVVQKEIASSKSDE